jgi:hypothetical protein
MSALGYVATLINSQGDGSALTNSTTRTSILPGQAKYTFGSGFFKNIGDQLLIEASGRISTVVTTPGTLTLDFGIGSVVVANGGAMTLSTTAKTNVAWYLRWLLTLRSLGSGTSATIMHEGVFTSEAAGATTVAGEAKSILLPQSAPAVGTGFDSTSAAIGDLFATWSVANAANSIQTHQFSLISL